MVIGFCSHHRSCGQMLGSESWESQQRGKHSDGRNFSLGTPRTTLKGSYVSPKCLLLHTELGAHGASITYQLFQNLLFPAATAEYLSLHSALAPCHLGLWSLCPSRCFHRSFTPSVHSSLLLYPSEDPWNQSYVMVLALWAPVPGYLLFSQTVIW